MSSLNTKDELSDRELLFVEAYVGEARFDPREAYALAGYYLGNKVGNYGKQVLSRPKVQAAIKKRLKEILDASFLDKSIILGALWKEAHRDGKGTSHAARIQALALIGKELGMFRDEPKVKDVGGGTTINVINFATDKEKIVKEVNTPAVITAAKRLDDDLQMAITNFNSGESESAVYERLLENDN